MAGKKIIRNIIIHFGRNIIFKRSAWFVQILISGSGGYTIPTYLPTYITRRWLGRLWSPDLALYVLCPATFETMGVFKFVGRRSLLPPRKHISPNTMDPPTPPQNNVTVLAIWKRWRVRDNNSNNRRSRYLYYYNEFYARIQSISVDIIISPYYIMLQNK